MKEKVDIDKLNIITEIKSDTFMLVFVKPDGKFREKCKEVLNIAELDKH